jgi:hypothetical protein
MKEYITYKEHIFKNEPLDINDFCLKNGLEGTEIFFDDIIPRTDVLFSDNAGKKKLLRSLNELRVKRLHCSYWAYPASFLTKSHLSELIKRFGSVEAVREYYGDLTGDHIWKRWRQEYEIACALNAQAYTFHLIDYAPIDGEWEFTIPISEIKQAMVYMIQQFLLNLEKEGILNDSSPKIEIENAGWGLEYGTQSKTDYIYLFSQLYDPGNKIKIGWDINHLLHAIGIRTDSNTACFMLPDFEKNDEMIKIEQEFGNRPNAFAYKWLESNILALELNNKTGSIHLSDCKLKNFEYFLKGKLQPPYLDRISALRTWEEKEEFGVSIVLTHYDSHVPLQTGILDGPDMQNLIRALDENNDDFAVLHELKNSESIQSDLDIQKKALIRR